MRIAISGSHGAGKTTLAERFAETHPAYDVEPEPYEALADRGVVFSDEPEPADFIQQLEQSLATLRARQHDPDVIFDRCPLDFVAYLDVVDGADAVSANLVEQVEDALEIIDLIVFVPLEPSTARLAIEQPVLRRRVDRRLKEIFRDDALSLFGRDRPRVIEVAGSIEQRSAMIAGALEDGIAGPRA